MVHHTPRHRIQGPLGWLSAASPPFLLPSPRGVWCPGRPDAPEHAGRSVCLLPPPGPGDTLGERQAEPPQMGRTLTHWQVYNLESGYAPGRLGAGLAAFLLAPPPALHSTRITGPPPPPFVSPSPVSTASHFPVGPQASASLVLWRLQVGDGARSPRNLRGLSEEPYPQPHRTHEAYVGAQPGFPMSPQHECRCPPPPAASWAPCLRGWEAWRRLFSSPRHGPISAHSP